MNSCLFSARKAERKRLQALRLAPGVVLSIGAMLYFCICGAPRAIGASDFSPLPKPSPAVLTNAIILVSPATLNFGSVTPGKSVTNTFLVENVGHGKLVGTAAVSAPFKILAGGSYTLTDREIQVVTVAYTPRRARADKAVVTFTGGGGSKVTVTGKAVREKQ